jgi:iron complex outermembrane receptor protein
MTAASLHVSLTLACAVMVAISSHAAAGQTATIEGRLARPDGTPLAGVMVSTSGASVETDRDGRFALGDVPVGLVTVEMMFGPHRTTIVDVAVTAPSTRLDRTLDWPLTFAESVTVSAAGRRIQRLFDAPASVSVVDESVIARDAPQGQVPALLAGAPGVELTQSGVFDFNMNIRGLNAALTRRILTLVDGRDPASVLIGAQEWAAFALPLDEIAKIEIVRGPGAALYGTNAFNGVVDITSIAPRDSPGGKAEITFGERDSVRLSGRYAGSLGARSFYRVHGTISRTDDFYVSRTAGGEYPGLPVEVQAPARDRTAVGTGGARLDVLFGAARQLIVEGGWSHLDGNVLLTGAGRLQGTGTERPWARAALSTAAWRLSGYYDGRYGDQVSLAAGNSVVDRSSKTNVEAIRVLAQSSTSRLVGGAAYRYLHADTRNESGASTILRNVHHAHETSAFAQFDQSLGPRLKAVLALRVDDSTLHTPEWSPKASLVYSISPTHSARFSYGHAFQTGSFVHFFTRAIAAPPLALGAIEAALQPFLGGVPLGFSSVPVLALGNDQLEVERVNSFEGGYSGVWGGKALISASYYYNRIDNLITPLIQQVGTELGRINPQYQPYVPPSALSAAQQNLVLGALRTSLPPSVYALMSNDLDGAPIVAAASYTNLAKSRLQGGEIGLQYFVTPSVNLDIGFSALEFTPDVPLTDPIVTANAPPRAVTVGLSYQGGPIGVSGRYRWAAAFDWNGGAFRGPVPAYSTADLAASYAMTPRTTIRLNVANLLDNQHYEIFGGDLLQRRALVSLIQTW